MSKRSCIKWQTGATILLAVAACISAVAALKSMYRYGKDLKDATQMMNNMATTMVKQFEFSTRPIVSIVMSDMRETEQPDRY